jgi:putative ABC transport system substrate-binding protein
MSTLAAELASKRLELLRAIVPRVRRVGVFWDPGEPEELAEWKELQVAAGALGIELLSLPVPAFGDVEKVFAASARPGVDALLNVGYLGPSRYRGKPILAIAAAHRLPGVYGWPGLVEAGGLFSYSPDYGEIFRRAANHVHKILNGAKAGDLPVEQPTKFDLVVNLRTARALQLTIPRSVLLLADKVIQ